MRSISPAASLRSSESGLSSCSDFSTDAHSDVRMYLEESSMDCNQEDSVQGSKHNLRNLSSIGITDGGQQPYTPMESDVPVHDSWTTKDEEIVGSLHDPESGDHSLERVGSSVTKEISGTSPCDSELDAEFWVPPEPEDHVDENEVSVINDDDDDDEYGDGTNWGKPSSLSSFEEERNGGRTFKEEKRKALEEVMNGKFKALVHQLLKSVGAISSGKDGENWADIVASLSWKAAKFVKPDAAEGKAMDPDGYVKVKCIAMGSPSQSQFIKGLVFKKHAAHKHMRTRYEKPKLLLIQGSLGLSTNGLSSFESMQQERDSLKNITDVLELYQPNVILVEKTVSRDIQESILGKGVTLVLDMKLHRLERLARCTGSPLLSSDVLFGQKLRQCDSFRVEKFVEEHDAFNETSRKPSKTLMFLEGCPTRLGCTILLVGADSHQLKKIKCVVRCAVVMAYHFMLETYFLSDLRVMFSTISFTEVLKQAYSNQELPTVGTSDPSSRNGESLTDSDIVARTLDIAISNGFHEEGVEYSLGANSPFSAESYNPVALSGFSSLSDSLIKAMDDNFPLFSMSRKALSAYFTFGERNSNDQGQGDFQVPISPEAVDHCNTEVKGIVDEDKENIAQAHYTSTFSEEPLEAQKSSEDNEDSIPIKDGIKAVLDSESILVLMSSRNAKRGIMCEQSHFSHITFYRNFDVPLGKFLRENLLNQRLQCKTCNELPEAHFYYYAHHNKQLKFQVRRLPTDKILPGETDGKLWMWSRCGKCICQNGISTSTKRVMISTDARGLSFGKFLELSFSNPLFRRKASCGHSLHKDYLFFFGLGPMVGMIKYSKIVTYSVSLPPQKLQFGNLIRGELLEKEFEDVYMKGNLMFLEIEKSLMKARSRYLGMTMNIQGSIKKFSDIEKMLKEERSQFEVDIQNALKKGDGVDGMYKFLRLNKVRMELLLESCIWDRRLHYLLSSDLSAVGGETRDQGVTSQTCMDNAQEEAYGLDIVVEDAENALCSQTPYPKLVASEEESGIEKEIPIDGQNKSRKQDGPFSPAPVTDDLNMPSVGTIIGNGSFSRDSPMKLEVQNQFLSDDGSLQTSLPSFVILQTDKVVPITSELEGPLLGSRSSHSGGSQFRLSLDMNNDMGWVWNPFIEIKKKYIHDLWRGSLPKFEMATSLTLDTTAYKLITDEGSRLHIPLGTDDFILSDYEDEFSSIISCSLALLNNIPVAFQDLDDDTIKEKGIMMSNDYSWNLTRIPSLDSTHWSSSSYLDSDGIRPPPSITEETHLSSHDSLDLLDSAEPLGAVHPEVPMRLGKVSGKPKYSVLCLYSSQFRHLRNRCCSSEVDYIASLSRCKNWDAKGGKSKSFFAKTLDDRFIIKEIKKAEFEAFMKFAPNYFEYMNQCYELGNQTCLAKILGIYQVTIRPSKNGKELRHDLMVMENLSFGRNIDRQYDLKGALHARFNSTCTGAGEVLLDQNFVNDMNVSPLYVNDQSKRILIRAVWNDTNFLKSINVMDYSLLVGVDATKRQLSCGIIDYLRQYTWDKQLENWVKSSLVVPKNQLPTIISPIEYRNRFRKFIGKYFLGVPDHWCSRRSSYPCLLCGNGDVGDDEENSQSKSTKAGEPAQ